MFIQGDVEVLRHGEYRSGDRQGKPYTVCAINDGVSRVELMLEGFHNFGRFDQVYATIVISRGQNGRTYINAPDWQVVQPDYDSLIQELKDAKKGIGSYDAAGSDAPMHVLDQG